jgi:hypothetical protein
MARTRDDDDDDRPRRRRDDDDDDDDDRPRRRRRRDDDDDDDYPNVRKKKLTGMDGMFANTNIVMLILFGFCCGYISLTLGIVGLCVCKNEKARTNAMIVTIIAGIMSVLGTGFQILSLMKK